MFDDRLKGYSIYLILRCPAALHSHSIHCSFKYLDALQQRRKSCAVAIKCIITSRTASSWTQNQNTNTPNSFCEHCAYISLLIITTIMRIRGVVVVQGLYIRRRGSPPRPQQRRDAPHIGAIRLQLQ